MIEKRTALLGCVLTLTVFFLSGCGKKEGDEPTKYRSQAGLEKLSRKAAKQQRKVAGGTADNPGFYNSPGIQGKAAEVTDLDAVLRPVLRKLFGDAKIISESGKPDTRPDGEVIENKFIYAVKKRLAADDGFNLHTALCGAHFSGSPRLGSKPTEWRGNVTMSLFTSTSRRTYSLVINVDTNKQQISVESYKLGSKYDRLM